MFIKKNPWNFTDRTLECKFPTRLLQQFYCFILVETEIFLTLYCLTRVLVKFIQEIINDSIDLCVEIYGFSDIKGRGG